MLHIGVYMKYRNKKTLISKPNHKISSVYNCLYKIRKTATQLFGYLIQKSWEVLVCPFLIFTSLHKAHACLLLQQPKFHYNFVQTCPERLLSNCV